MQVSSKSDRPETANLSLGKPSTTVTLVQEIGVCLFDIAGVFTEVATNAPVVVEQTMQPKGAGND